MANPKVTVLIDTYNHERFIEQAIESVLVQDFPRSEMEILVVDDGSTDRTPDLVRKFEPQVRLIRKPNGGQASAFNAGIPEARGEFVAFLDGDDWWEPRKLTRVAEAFSADPSLGIAGHGIVMLHRDGSQLTETLREGFQFQANNLEGAKLFRLRKSLLGTSRMAIRSEVLRRIGPVPEAIRVQADEYLFTLAAVLTPARILPEPLTFYRFHDANGFQFSDMDPAKLRNLNSSMLALAKALSDALNRLPVDSGARRAILEIVFADAARTRLYVDGGWPWETLAAEWTFRRVHGQFSSPLSALRNALALAPALFLPPRAFYNMRSRIGRARPFRILRQHAAASDSRQHVENEWRSAAPGTRPAAAEKR
jgi:glycosyltransferase involved in cell wall biosynthesis